MTHDHTSELGQSIQDAVNAARAAGMELPSNDTPGAATDLDERPHLSYSFRLNGLPAAPDVDKVEAAVETLPGVQCKIVHPHAQAWITATVDTSPDDIAGVFASLGITATLSDASMLRNASLRTNEHHPRRTTHADMPGELRRRRRIEARSLDRARRAGFGQRDKPARPKGDVLYTARDLVTPARMWVALILTIPVLILAYVEPAQFPGWQWVELALATPVVTWCAFPFHQALLGGARRGITALDGASAVAIIIAYLWSALVICFAPTGHRGWHSGFTWFATTQGTANGPELFLDVACGTTLLLLIGRRYSIRARRLLLDEMDEKALAPDTECTRVCKKRGCAEVQEERIPISELNHGDDIIVTAGETIPVDGKIIGGKACLRTGLIDAHEPTNVKVGSIVYAGSVIAEGKIKVRAQRTGHATRWYAVQHWLSDSEERQRHASMEYARRATVLLPVAMTVASASFILWGLIASDYNAALRTALAVLSGVAPVALALSPALALRLGIESAARNGLLIRDGETLKTLENVDTVVFNRVGTLALPKMQVESVTAAAGESEEMVMRIAGALAMESLHPLAEALVEGAREARKQSGDSPDLPVRYELIQVENERSGDVTGRIGLVYVDAQGHETVSQVDAALWRPVNMSHLYGRLAVAATSGGTPVVVRWKGKDRGVITLFDPFKDDADEAVMRLESHGVETVMLTRDTYPVARRFADYLGISTVLAGITNDRKPGAIRGLQVSGAEVAMVGDNTVMDVLRASNVSLMYASADDVAYCRKRGRSMSVALLRHDVMAVPQLITHARRVCAVIDQNQFLAWAYNIVMLVLAAAGAIPPIVATVLMLGSSLIVEGFSMRARSFPSFS